MKAYAVVKQKNRKLYTSNSLRRLVLHKPAKFPKNHCVGAVFKKAKDAIKVFKSYPWSRLAVYKCDVIPSEEQPTPKILSCSQVTLIKKLRA